VVTGITLGNGAQTPAAIIGTAAVPVAGPALAVIPPNEAPVQALSTRYSSLLSGGGDDLVPADEDQDDILPVDFSTPTETPGPRRNVTPPTDVVPLEEPEANLRSEARDVCFADTNWLTGRTEEAASPTALLAPILAEIGDPSSSVPVAAAAVLMGGYWARMPEQPEPRRRRRLQL